MPKTKNPLFPVGSKFLAERGRFGRGLRIADLPGWVATQGEVFTADPFGGKKGDREDPMYAGYSLSP